MKIIARVIELLVVLVFGVTLVGCQQSADSRNQPDALSMGVPIDPTTLQPSPLYEAKTEEEIARVRNAREKEEAERAETLQWVDHHCKVTKVMVYAPFYTLQIPAGKRVCRIDVDTTLRYDVEMVAGGETVIGFITGPISDQYQPGMTGYLSKEGVTGVVYLKPIVGPTSASSGTIKEMRIWTKSKD